MLNYLLQFYRITFYFLVIDSSTNSLLDLFTKTTQWIKSFSKQIKWIQFHSRLHRLRRTVPDLKTLVKRISARAARSLATWPIPRTPCVPRNVPPCKRWSMNFPWREATQQIHQSWRNGCFYCGCAGCDSHHNELFSRAGCVVGSFRCVCTWSIL